jgi:hypothetical protein
MRLTRSHTCTGLTDVLLSSVLQAFRKQQAAAQHTFPDPAGGPNKTLSFADLIVAAAVATVKQCSKGHVIIPHTVSRKDAAVADDTLLPTPATIVEKKHIEAFANMVGWHWLAGFHRHLTFNLITAHVRLTRWCLHAVMYTCSCGFMLQGLLFIIA